MYDSCEDFEEDPLAADLEPEPPASKWDFGPPEYDVKRSEWLCPKCGNVLVLRAGKYGAFYGCSNFPDCRYTVDAKKINGIGVIRQTQPEELFTQSELSELNPPKLKPCPFCGGEGVYIIGAMDGKYTWHVSCTKCHAVIGCKPGRSKCDAGKDWNTRYGRNA